MNIIEWSIFNTEIKGEIQRYDGMKYSDLLHQITKKTGHSFLRCSTFNQMNKNDDVITENINYVSVYSDTVQKRIELSHTYSSQPKNIIPDYDQYKLAIIKFNVFRYNEKVNNDLPPLNYWRNIEKVLLTTIVKIIKETEDQYIIKFPEPYQINMGRGPTVKSLYAILNKNEKKIYPIYMYSTELELFIIKNGKLTNEYENLNYSWFSVEKDTCPICLENNLNYYSYCNEYHLTCCQDCIKNLNKCPICHAKIIVHDQVQFI